MVPLIPSQLGIAGLASTEVSDGSSPAEDTDDTCAFVAPDKPGQA